MQQLQILETVYNVIKEDITLKENEKQWRYFFSNWIFNINNGRYSDKEYITMSSNYLQKIFGHDYNSILKYFIEKKWLAYYLSSTGGKSYTVGLESAKYIVTLPLDCDLIQVTFTSKTVLNKITPLLNGTFRKKLEIKKYTDNVEKIEYIEKNYKEVLDKIDVTVPQELIDKIDETRNELETVKHLLPMWNGYSRKPKHYRKINDRIDTIKQTLTDLLQEKHKLQDLSKENKNKAFTIDGFGLRAHTSFTRLKRNYREMIRMNNEEIIEIDIKNCQPWLLSNFEGITDTKFIDDCAKGILYEQFYINGITVADRDYIKVELYKIFFGGYQICRAAYYKYLQNKKSILSIFISLYPTVWEFIENYNADNHRNLCEELQRMESDLVLFSSWNKLFELGIDALTIHDALYVNKEHKDIALQTLKDFITTKKYTMPTFKTK